MSGEGMWNGKLEKEGKQRVLALLSNSKAKKELKLERHMRASFYILFGFIYLDQLF